MPIFEELGLSLPVLQAIAGMGFEEPTPIQEKTIPLALAGRDLIGRAQTGTGKTAAFGIPLVERVDNPLGALVIAPTRELAIQVAEELNKIGQYKRVAALPIYGGQDINRQIRALKNRPQIIVGTPGRLMDHLRRGTLRLSQVSLVVLDEADEMLDMGFIDDIKTILQEVPTTRQTMLFSATMPQPIQELAQRFMNDPEYIDVTPKEVTVPNMQQYYIEVQEQHKFDVFCRLLDMHSPERAIVFGRTKRRVDELAEGLNKRGYSAEGIHGDLTQAKRDTVMRHFKEGLTEILVATDVAARGLDISGVTHVYNFDLPQDPESYVHRIGRTGRAGQPGVATTLVAPREIGHLRMIERATKKRIVRQPMPTVTEVLREQQRIAVDRLLKTASDGVSGQYKELAEGLLAETDSITLVAAALKLLTKEPDRTPVTLSDESGYRPRSSRRANTSVHRKHGGHKPRRK
ncbi:MAG: DEAD/DEAH box helicase [Firmicutes bacterium]|nr:DEAD/DEAH box helicase [Bacillota bacterium]